MEHIINGRGTGKTKELMLKAKENNGTILCANPNAMKSKSLAYGITGIDFHSYTDYIEEWNNPGSPPFYIDELETFLAVLGEHLGHIEGYTLTVEDN